MARLVTKSKWPKGRWMFMYGANVAGTCKRLSDARAAVNRTLRIYVKMTELSDHSKFRVPLHAIIVRVGSVVAYHGKVENKRFVWTRIS